jgi:hypothetical protein
MRPISGLTSRPATPLCDFVDLASLNPEKADEGPVLIATHRSSPMILFTGISSPRFLAAMAVQCPYPTRRPRHETCGRTTDLEDR